MIRAQCEHGGRLAWGVAVGIVVLAGVAAAGLAARAGAPVTVTVDGMAETVRSMRPDVAALLGDLGLELRAEDLVAPAPATPLRAGLEIEVRRARLGLVSADTRMHRVYSRAESVGELVADAGVILLPEDEVRVDGEPAAHDAPLPTVAPPDDAPRFGSGRSWGGREPAPVRVTIRRAVRIVVHDGAAPYEVFTTAETVGEALLREQLTLYLGDRVQPNLGSRVTAGMHVYIERSTHVLVHADGRSTHTRTRAKTVGDALMDLGVMVAGSDRVTPALGEPIADRQEIRVVRVSEVTFVESEAIPYASYSVPDDELEIDQQRLAQEGRDGERRRRWKVTTEDGSEVARVLLDDWVAAEPVPRLTAYGRKIVLRTLDTPDGPVTYWRKIRMYTVSYSPARSGTPITAAWYGRTRIGLTLRKGIVAVDPSVIPLQSWLYVPGYGKAIAGDTGGGVRGKLLDLGYSDADYVSWHWWSDVYLLSPAPAASRIMWVLPNYPPPGFPYNR